MGVKLRETTLIIDIDDEISEWWGVSYKSIKNSIDYFRDRFTAVKVFINSPGGDVTEGIAIRNEILRLVDAGFDVDGVVMGVAASIAGPIALACTSLTMTPGSYLMVHRPYSFAIVDFEEAENLSVTLKKMNSDIAEIFALSSNLDKTAIESAMQKETWYSSAEAVDYGFADSVLIPEANTIQNCARIMPKSSGIWNSFKNLPDDLQKRVDSANEENDKKYKIENQNLTSENEEDNMSILAKLYAANPGAEAEVTTLVDAARKEGDSTAIATAISNEHVRIFSLFDLTSDTEMDGDLKNAIENGKSDADLALALFKNGKAGKAAAVETPVDNNRPGKKVVKNQLPPIDPSGDLKPDADAVDKAEEDAFKNLIKKVNKKTGGACA